MKGARVVVQSGIKNGLEGLDALRRVMATEYVAWGMNRVGWMTNRVWIMRHIRNREGPKRGGEIRHPAGGRDPRTKDGVSIRRRAGMTNAQIGFADALAG